MSDCKKNQAQKQRERRAAYRIAGKCHDCGKPAAEQKRCPPCREKYNDRQRRLYKKRSSKRREVGQCVRCGEPSKTWNCAVCNKNMRPLQRKLQRQADERAIANGLCSECHKVPPKPGLKRCQTCIDQYDELRRVRDKSVRDAAFAAYGGAFCACCEEKTPEFLQIDHIAGNGAQHRRDDPSAYKIYYWLRRHKYPAGFRVLCVNCNWSRGRYGYCPHERQGGREDGTEENECGRALAEGLQRPVPG